MNKDKHTTARNADIIAKARRFAREAAEQGRSITLDELAQMVRDSRPNHFYQNYDRASAILHTIERSNVNQVVINAEARQMWLDMLTQVRQVMQMRQKLNFSQALTHVLLFGRPERFFVTSDTIRRILSPHFKTILTAVS